MKAKTYSEKLLDPRWQRKRLEILQRDEFTCRACEDTGSQLHVHHIKYEKGEDPWESDDDNLVTLCDSCHSLWHLLENIGADWSQIYFIAELYNDIEYKSFCKFKDKNG